MPLFMDRHDVPGATAKDVAEAHVSDLEMATKYGVQFLSYWFDADGGGVFCFARAPNEDTLEAVHRESHGLIPNEIISVSESDVLRFLGRIHDPEDHTQLTSPFRTILFTDLEGSTALLEAVGETAFLALLSEHDLIVRRALLTWRGREVKHTGDGIMAAFDGVAAALDCAIEIRERFAARSTPQDESALRVRIGMAAGRPVDRNDDIYGESVVLASRICDTADAGSVFTSDVVQAMGSEQGFRFRDVGRVPLKGFSAPVPVFEALGRDGD
jgi:class 3 adenylate cyclase